MAFGVHGHTGDFAEIRPRRQLGKSGTDSEWQIGDAVLGETTRDVEISNSAQNTAFIDNLRFEIEVTQTTLILFQFSFPVLMR